MTGAASPPLWRLGAIGVAIAAYAFVSHQLMVHVPDRAWAVAALFGPLWAAVAFGAWQRRHMPTLATCAVVVVAIAVVVARGGIRDIHLMYVLQHAGVHAALAWVFGSTLRNGATPLVSALAEKLHDDYGAPLASYTRKVTRMWAIYFAAMVGASALLYALAPWDWWSLFCNLGTPLAAGALFLVEYGYRRWAHPEFQRVTMADALRAWRARGAAEEAAP
jgi:uncharacterized membrane protein